MSSSLEWGLRMYISEESLEMLLLVVVVVWLEVTLRLAVLVQQKSMETVTSEQKLLNRF